MENISDSTKIAIGIRSARVAIGWNQQEFADLLGVAKSTVARIETLEMSAKADFLTKALRLFRDAGITLDLLDSESVSIRIGKSTLLEAKKRLEDESKRRSDRRGLMSLPESEKLLEKLSKK
jgi:transcriptional regulator with XRE-family HTH domain